MDETGAGGRAGVKTGLVNAAAFLMGIMTSAVRGR
jgi:hypothetical protein